MPPKTLRRERGSLFWKRLQEAQRGRGEVRQGVREAREWATSWGSVPLGPAEGPAEHSAALRGCGHGLPRPGAWEPLALLGRPALRAEQVPEKALRPSSRARRALEEKAVRTQAAGSRACGGLRRTRGMRGSHQQPLQPARPAPLCPDSSSRLPPAPGSDLSSELPSLSPVAVSPRCPGLCKSCFWPVLLSHRLDWAGLSHQPGPWGSGSTNLRSRPPCPRPGSSSVRISEG